MTSPFKDRMGQPLSWLEAGEKISGRFYNYYLDAKIALLWFLGYIPFHSIRRFVFQLAGVKIGRQSTIHIGARFYQPKNVQIGEGTIIGDHAILDGRAKLIIGNHVAMASRVMIFNSQHDVEAEDFKTVVKPVEINDYVFVGPRAIVLPGVKIGRGAVVAAGAVVTKDVEPMTVVGGVPAKPIRKRGVKELNYRLGRPRLFQ